MNVHATADRLKAEDEEEPEPHTPEWTPTVAEQAQMSSGSDQANAGSGQAVEGGSQGSGG